MSEIEKRKKAHPLNASIELMESVDAEKFSDEERLALGDLIAFAKFKIWEDVVEKTSPEGVKTFPQFPPMKDPSYPLRPPPLSPYPDPPEPPPSRRPSQPYHPYDWSCWFGKSRNYE